MFDALSRFCVFVFKYIGKKKLCFFSLCLSLSLSLSPKRFSTSWLKLLRLRFSVFLGFWLSSLFFRGAWRSFVWFGLRPTSVSSGIQRRFKMIFRHPYGILASFGSFAGSFPTDMFGTINDQFMLPASTFHCHIQTHENTYQTLSNQNIRKVSALTFTFT